MEITFSCISGIGDSLENLVYKLNERSSAFFQGRIKAGNEGKRIMLILVTQNISPAEEEKYKVKFARFSTGIAINFYASNLKFLKYSENEKIEYIEAIVLNSIKANKRLSKLDINMDELIDELKAFFKSLDSGVN